MRGATGVGVGGGGGFFRVRFIPLCILSVQNVRIGFIIDVLMCLGN